MRTLQSKTHACKSGLQCTPWAMSSPQKSMDFTCSHEGHWLDHCLLYHMWHMHLWCREIIPASQSHPGGLWTDFAISRTKNVRTVRKFLQPCVSFTGLIRRVKSGQAWLPYSVDHYWGLLSICWHVQWCVWSRLRGQLNMVHILARYLVVSSL